VSAGWVAATVRSQALARNRLGAAGARSLASLTSVQDARGRLEGTLFANAVDRATSMDELDRSTRAVVLWELRVLAGWMPPAGAGLARALAAGHERDNIVGRLRELDGGPPELVFELGALATVWPKCVAATTRAALLAEVERSASGSLAPLPAHISPGALHDVLTATALRRLADTAPAASGWAAQAGAILLARMLFVDMQAPPPVVLRSLGPLLGGSWSPDGNSGYGQPQDFQEFVARLPDGVRRGLAGVSRADQLWQGDVRLRTQVDAEATRMIRSADPGPNSVLAAVTLVDLDAWRIRAALAAVAAGIGHSEVLDAVA
jgi:hypothetical protein